MSKIRVLADHVANQIAAGEVVERPASVAKELVENSIDAGAKRITIEIEAGGRRLLKVSDDGEGMMRDDAILAFERHATSKIRDTEDLAAIGTLGFRGEALASIASVARVELITCTEDAKAATRVTIDGGRMRDVKDAAHPRGTTIAVRDLFFNIPARRKFLRSEATETFHLTNLVTHYALAHPEIAFTFVNNGREVVRAAVAKDLRERAYQIFGEEFLENLLEVNGGDAQVARVTGYVSAPRDRRTSRDSQYLFVNRRFVRDRMIGRSLSEGYRSILPHGVYPAALLFIETPLEEVDVNVHPAKTEVRFRRQAAVADAVREAVRTALASASYVPAPEPPPVPEPIMTATASVSSFTPQPRIEFVPPPPPPPAPPRPEVAIMVAEPSGDEIARDIDVMIQSAMIQSSQSVKSVALPPLNSAEKLAREVTPESLSTNIRPLGQLEESFIIATDDEGLLLIDQHV
ncbi:MAG TPA: DNA mismatch repair endonuclease MutL, partial [Pyrinomonadaceae bacterium]|nr:DNA mismatch repair endonuclease MutL [Pyrinomonadaceae bacterium]